VLDRYPREVKLVFKNFPLASHRFARKAAGAALAAHAQGKFWEFHNKLFESYRVINDAKIQDIARELGLDMERFTKDMMSPAIQDLIARDVNNGRKIGVRGIPKVFINGKILKKRSLEGFKQMIEAESRKRK
jgi:predicted DsbA family dithiol-disulfide isomerase